MILCKYCNVNFEKGCHELLMDGKLPVNVCGKDHSFLTVPVLLPEQVFKEGEVLVSGTAIPLAEWKTTIREKYGL